MLASCGLAALAGLPWSAAAQSLVSAYEDAPVVGLDEVLSPGLIRSGNHRVLDEVRGRGNSLSFTMESDFGLYRVDSIAMVALRVREIRTLAQAIDDYQRSNEQLAAELRGVMTVGADNWVDILTSPVKTVGSMAGQAANNVGQTFTEIGGIAEGSTGPQASRPGVYESMIPSDPALASHKRNAASQLGLDVFSSNPRVQEFLNTLARARGGGNRNAGIITVSLPTGDVRQVAGGRLRNAATMAITRMTIPELYRHNESRLAALGVSEPQLGAFLTHRALSPRHKTLIVEHLVFMDRVGNPGAALLAASAARSEVEALAHVQTTQMLALYHEQEAPVRRLVSGGHVLLAVAADEALIVVLPFDVLYWNRDTEEIFTAVRAFAEGAGLGRRVVLLDGTATERARDEFTDLGFDLRTRFPYR